MRSIFWPRAGRDLRGLPLRTRKRLLALALPKAHDQVRFVEHYQGGVRLFQAVKHYGLEGMLAKRVDSPYQAGRTGYWPKVRSPTARDQRW